MRHGTSVDAGYPGGRPKPDGDCTGVANFRPVHLYARRPLLQACCKQTGVRLGFLPMTGIAAGCAGWRGLQHEPRASASESRPTKACCGAVEIPCTAFRPVSVPYPAAWPHNSRAAFPLRLTRQDGYFIARMRSVDFAPVRMGMLTEPADFRRPSRLATAPGTSARAPLPARSVAGVRPRRRQAAGGLSTHVPTRSRSARAGAIRNAANGRFARRQPRTADDKARTKRTPVCLGKERP